MRVVYDWMVAVTQNEINVCKKDPFISIQSIQVSISWNFIFIFVRELNAQMPFIYDACSIVVLAFIPIRQKKTKKKKARMWPEMNQNSQQRRWSNKRKHKKTFLLENFIVYIISNNSLSSDICFEFEFQLRISNSIKSMEKRLTEIKLAATMLTLLAPFISKPQPDDVHWIFVLITLRELG